MEFISQEEYNEIVYGTNDKKKLNLQEPIRMVGTVIVPYKVHPQVTGELKVKVVEA